MDKVSPFRAESCRLIILSIADAFDAMTSTRSYRKGMPIEVALKCLAKDTNTQFDSDLVNDMCELGRAGDLAHIVGRATEGIPIVSCPHCGPVIAVPRNTQDSNVIYCRACHGELKLYQVGDTFEAKMIGMTDDSCNLEPLANEAGVEDLLAQIG